MKRCLICGSNGTDLIFSFYCSNRICQNYNQDYELKNIVYTIWKMYNRGESEEEFRHEFFSKGGRIEFPQTGYFVNSHKVYKPMWLKERIAKFF